MSNEKDGYFLLGNEECGIELTPNDVVFLQKGIRKTLTEMMREAQTSDICPYCGRKLEE